MIVNTAYVIILPYIILGIIWYCLIKILPKLENTILANTTWKRLTENDYKSICLASCVIYFVGMIFIMLYIIFSLM